MNVVPGWVNDPGPPRAVSGNRITTTGPPAPAPQCTPLPKGLIAGPIIAYRFWAVRSRGDDTCLTSLNSADQRWIPSMPMQAVCSQRGVRSSEGRHPTTAAPDTACRCGLYALKQARDCPDGWTESPDSCLRAIAAGRVALWGTVIEHEHGYRAEFAYPVAIWPWRPTNLPPGFPQSRGLWRLFARLGEDYGCQVLEKAP